LRIADGEADRRPTRRDIVEQRRELDEGGRRKLCQAAW
jgi:hypothetical protein